MQPEVLLTALADKSRLKILASLSQGPKFVEELSLQLNIGVSTVSFHLKKLLAADLVVAKKEQYYQTYSLKQGALGKEILALLSGVNPKEDAFKESVRRDCFTGGRVITLPVQVRKRHAVYEIFLESFKPSKAYTEGEASLILAELCEDFVTAKDEMLALGYLKRHNKKIYKS
ncbi:MAG: ArsR family transcriptional regulator [Clostridia bacterium]|nr:ArsR family transcriptional regulator [Clostridia bacterium]